MITTSTSVYIYIHRHLQVKLIKKESTLQKHYSCRLSKIYKFSKTLIVEVSLVLKKEVHGIKNFLLVNDYSSTNIISNILIQKPWIYRSELKV